MVPMASAESVDDFRGFECPNRPKNGLFFIPILSKLLVKFRLGFRLVVLLVTFPLLSCHQLANYIDNT